MNLTGHEDKDMLFGHHVVCIIDMLGQKEKLSQWADVAADGQMPPELMSAIKSTAGTVLHLGEHFGLLFRGMSEDPLSDGALDLLPKGSRAEYARFCEGEINDERFSDTFLFYSSVVNSRGDVTVVPLYQSLTACCIAMLMSLAIGAPLRGGVSIGAGAKLTDGRFYGPAMADAHHLESEVAMWPRIVISKEIKGFLRNGPPGGPMSHMAERCRTFLCTDVDGREIVDFLGRGVEQLFEGDEARGKALVKKAYTFVCTEAARFRELSNSKLATRYHLLKSYMDARLPIWGLSPEA